VQRGKGGVKVATAVDVSGGTIFIDTDEDVSWVRSR